MSIDPNPMPWIQPAYDQVLNELRAKRLAHAVLVQGDQGVGIEFLAQSIAHLRLCREPLDKACGQCKSCLLMKSGTHPDIKILEPSGAGQVIKVDQIREAVVFLSQTPQISDWKVVWVTEAHRMNHNAANALLKVLEEPPGNSLLILVTDRPQILLPTVRSRCRKLMVPLPSETETRAYCSTEAVSEQQLESLLPILGLRPTKICEWSKEGHLSQWQTLEKGLEQFGQNGITTMALTDSLKDIALSDILAWLMQMAAGRSRSVSGTPVDRAWLSLYDRLAAMHQDAERGTNPNKQLLLDECFLRWKAAFDTEKSLQN